MFIILYLSNLTISILMDYHPELDESPDIKTKETSYYLSHVCVVYWMMKLGCLEIITEISMLALHLDLPREVRVVLRWH